MSDLFQPMPYTAAQRMADFLWPPGQLNYWKSCILESQPLTTRQSISQTLSAELASRGRSLHLLKIPFGEATIETPLADIHKTGD